MWSAAAPPILRQLVGTSCRITIKPSVRWSPGFRFRRTRIMSIRCRSLGLTRLRTSKRLPNRTYIWVGAFVVLINHRVYFLYHASKFFIFVLLELGRKTICLFVILDDAIVLDKRNIILPKLLGNEFFEQQLNL